MTPLVPVTGSATNAAIVPGPSASIADLMHATHANPQVGCESPRGQRVQWGAGTRMIPASSEYDGWDVRGLELMPRANPVDPWYEIWRDTTVDAPRHCMAADKAALTAEDPPVVRNTVSNPCGSMVHNRYESASRTGVPYSGET